VRHLNDVWNKERAGAFEAKGRGNDDGDEKKRQPELKRKKHRKSGESKGTTLKKHRERCAEKRKGGKGKLVAMRGKARKKALGMPEGETKTGNAWQEEGRGERIQTRPGSRNWGQTLLNDKL